jgi:hypothetical protein
MGDEAADRFLFRIDDVFTITGRGTVVAGFIEQGAVRAGDRLRLVRGDGTEGPIVVCRSVEFVDRSGWRPGDPVTVGLIAPGLSGHDAARGDMLAGEAPFMIVEEAQDLSEPWFRPGPENASALGREAAAEIGPGHELSGRALTVLARCGGCGEIAVSLDDGTFALVHLTWAQHPEPSSWPLTQRLGGYATLGTAIAAHQH